MHAQLELFETLACAERFARKPRFMLAKEQGQYIRPFRFAPGFPYIQAQAPGVAFRLVLDLDRDVRAIARCNDWGNLLNAPHPNYVLLNRQNGHAHLFYELEKGVATHEAARTRPLRYLTAVETALRDLLGGDIGYTGFICKSPFNDAWELLPGRKTPYSLGELADYLDLPRLAPTRETAQGFGRNCTLFNELRRWAYTALASFDAYDLWCRAVRSQAEGLNTFPSPLGDSEVRAIARSVAKWTWQNLGAGEYGVRFAETQRHRQKLGAAKKRAVTTTDVVLAIAQLRAAGKRVSKTAVAKIVGCSQQNLSKHYGELF